MYYCGLDIGSTTIKYVILDKQKNIVEKKYFRHNADQQKLSVELFESLRNRFQEIFFVSTGSGCSEIVNSTESKYIQEVASLSLFVKEYHKDSSIVIEIGGQDSKLVSFNKENGNIFVSDMRMNGSCAGGTGAFIDQMATYLDIEVSSFNEFAKKGVFVHSVSGRCGVFAKTDIQPLVNQGVRKEDICLSVLHAVASQIIGGLSQGLEIIPTIILAGGPVKFNDILRDIFAEKLKIDNNLVVIPSDCEYMVAHGAALSGLYNVFLNKLHVPEETIKYCNISLCKTVEEKLRIDKIYKNINFLDINDIDTNEITLGIDAGSTTIKFVLLDKNKKIIDFGYSKNFGNPLRVFKMIFEDTIERIEKRHGKIHIKFIGITGYGANLFMKAFNVDAFSVETIAHAYAAKHFFGDVSFIIDIGGQDIKAVRINKGLVTDIILNEACSAGCGSFLENFASTLGLAMDEIGEIALSAKNPSKLGSRCTVFMNSSVISEQKNGKSVEDILAGLCYSVVENVFTKVIRNQNENYLGNKIVVQGGTFLNPAVFRAMEIFTKKQIFLAPFPGVMGAIGAGLLAKENSERVVFDPISIIKNFEYDITSNKICQLCENKCRLNIVKFNNGNSFITGNKCDRYNNRTKSENKGINTVRVYNENLLNTIFTDHEDGRVIGIPRALDFYRSLPFWNTFFRSLGFKVVVTPMSDSEIFREGERFVPSDTACLPAKVLHGHIEWLINKNIDTIFLPMMVRLPYENLKADNNFVCSVVHGYTQVIKNSHNNSTVFIDTPAFHWYNEKAKTRQILTHFIKEYGLSRSEILQAITLGNRSQINFKNKLMKSTENCKSDFKVILAARPYHYDTWINHKIADLLESEGIDVIISESIDLSKVDVSRSHLDNTMVNTTRLVASAFYAAEKDDCEMVFLVSFGCGHDAVLSDEIERIMSEYNKVPLIIKLDEVSNDGPLYIRVKSFIESIRQRRKQNLTTKTDYSRKLPVFSKSDKKSKMILIPNLSRLFSIFAAAVLRRDGFNVKTVDIADSEAINIGKRFVHNDVCYPAQVNAGELIKELRKSGGKNSVVGLAKNCDDCRAGQYSTIIRTALDKAGFDNVPIVTTGQDKKNLHPGFRPGLKFQIILLYSILLSDGLEMMYRRLRVYEIDRGVSKKIFDHYVKKIEQALSYNLKKAIKYYKRAVDEFNGVKIHNMGSKKIVGIVGEILVNHHENANNQLENFLENSDIEPYIPPMINFFRREVAVIKEKLKSKLSSGYLSNFLMSSITDMIYKKAIDRIEEITDGFKYRFPRFDIFDLAENIEGLIDKTFIAGEGWQIAGEIIQMRKIGIKSFVIVQPFGCMPNHISGRGMVKSLKHRYSDISIVSLDFDPDTSKTNIENRLMMLLNVDKI
ncbi:MAG: activase [Candidatus Delongbacteria bacterium]|nr:activase [Candidatus Delongbacteria bacterium]MBN2837068.1 activase [Candidatus Delongbacteria bacterium]